MGFHIDDNLMIPFYMTCPVADNLPAITTTNNAADSSLTCNFSTTPHKRLIEFHHHHNSPTEKEQSPMLISSHPPFSFLGEDISYQIQHQHSEIDRFVTQHMEKMRTDVAESRQRHGKRMLAAAEQGMMKRLKAKEEEIEKIGRLNWALEERVKSLSIENQIWRDMARTNEATANELRTNLERVVAQASSYEQRRRELSEDVESCCGSSDGDGRFSWLEEEEVMKEEERNKNCRNCGVEEPCVILLPCRHLCLCNRCGSWLNTCPVCNSNNTGSVHVNIS